LSTKPLSPTLPGKTSVTSLPEDRAVSLFVVPLFQVFVGIFLFIALLYGFRDLILFAGILLGVGIGANIWARLSPLGVSCDLLAERLRGFPDEPFGLHIRIVNAKCLPIRAEVGVYFADPYIHVEREGGGVEGRCRLLWHQACRLRKDITFLRRGVYRLGPPALVTGDLFGFYRREKKAASAMEAVIYPRIREITPVPVPRRDLYGVPGAKGLVEDPAYIYGTRDYQPGRPVRRIHWKASARYHRVQEKVCEPAQQEKTMLLLEVDGFAQARAEAAFEEIIETVASYGAWLDREGFAFGFGVNGLMTGGHAPVVPIARGPGQLARVLEALARVTMRREGDLLEVLSKAYPLRWGVSCLLFAHESSNAVDRVAAGLRHKKVPVVVLWGSSILADSRDPDGDGATDTLRGVAAAEDSAL